MSARVRRVEIAEMTRAVKRFYDRSTGAFLRLGTGRQSAVIHREIWDPGVASVEAAITRVHDLIHGSWLSAGNGAVAPKILDLGCGVGATLADLVARTGGIGTGITISEVQARRGGSRSGTPETQGSVSIVQGDYHAADLGVGNDLVYAVESLIHSPAPALVLERALKSLSPGGLLIVVDDFLKPEADPTAQVVREFVSGWKAYGLTGSRDLVGMVRTSGASLVEDRDLTPFINLARPRDRLIDWVVFLRKGPGRWKTFFNDYLDGLQGGAALQRALAQGLMEHRFLVFRRASRTTHDRSVAADARPIA